MTERALVALVAVEHEAVVLAEPFLMRGDRTRVAVLRQGDRGALVGDVDDVHGVAGEGRGDADLLALVVRVRADVADALGVVDRPVGAVAAGEDRARGGRDVDHVEAVRAGAGVDGVGEAGGLVDRHVVRRAEAVVDGVGGEGRRRIGDVAQPGQVEDLHAVAAGRIGDDEGVVGEDLDVAPGGGERLGRQVADVDRVLGVRDVDEGGAVGAPHEGVLDAGHRIGPAPDVVAGAAAEVRQGHLGEQVDAAAGVDVRGAAHAGDGGRAEGRRQQQGGGEDERGRDEVLGHAGFSSGRVLVDVVSRADRYGAGPALLVTAQRAGTRVRGRDTRISVGRPYHIEGPTR